MLDHGNIDSQNLTSHDIETVFCMPHAFGNILRFGTSLYSLHTRQTVSTFSADGMRTTKMPYSRNRPTSSACAGCILLLCFCSLFQDAHEMPFATHMLASRLLRVYPLLCPADGCWCCYNNADTSLPESNRKGRHFFTPSSVLLGLSFFFNLFVAFFLLQFWLENNSTE